MIGVLWIGLGSFTLVGQLGFAVHPLPAPHVGGQGENPVPSHRLAAGPDGLSQVQTGMFMVFKPTQ